MLEEEISRSSDPPPHHAAAARGEPADSLLGSHMPGLDFLRGTAVSMVVIYHLFYYEVREFPWHNPVLQSLFNLTGVGWTGVNLFFVLSGFLITGNLMDSLGRPNYYARFYIRRGLRILPLYYVLILLLALTHEASWNYTLACALFLANMPKLLLHSAYFGTMPAWSLAVEEQFYLVWPAVYRLLHRKWLIAFCLASMAVCPLMRWASYTQILHTGETFSKTWMIGDNLAVGALIAALLRTPGVTRRAIKWAGITILAVCFPLLLLTTYRYGGLKESSLGAGIGYSLMELVYASTLLLALVVFQRRRLPRPLTILVFLADISYGIYLLHMEITEFYDHFAGETYHWSAAALLTRFVVVSLLSTGVAVLSKKFFENPIMKLRKRMPSAA
jgi:peptidoglycan/LPS O-acetylase OafA/YrhL